MTEDKKTDIVVNNPHDVTFKKVMKDKAIAQDILLHNLPEEMMRDIDLDSMELLDGSFVSKELEESFSDVLYGVEVAGHDVYVALLLEHKSFIDKLAIFQVGRYLMDLWERVFQERGEVPIVFPIIFYHGKSAWNYETDIRKYIKKFDALPAYMKERLPTLKHDFITMETHDEERMYEYEPLTRFILRSFKFIFTDIDELVGALLTSVDDMQGKVSDEEMQAYIELFLFYYSQANKQITEEMLVEKIKKLGGKGTELMSILEARERKGIQEGIEMTKEELAQNMLSDGLAVEFVAKYAKLPVKKVEELREKLN